MSSKVSIMTILVVAGAICATYGLYLSRGRNIACPPTLQQSSTVYAHPFDCRKFYYCVLGNLIEFWCPNRMNFDQNKKACVYQNPLVVKCPIRPTGTSATTKDPDWMSSSPSTSYPTTVSEITVESTPTTIELPTTTSPYTWLSQIETEMPINTTAFCGSVHYINGTSGYLVSPFYPQNYVDDMDCYYNITTPPGTYLSFHVNHLDLENAIDFVEISEGTNNESTLLTGSEQPDDIYTNSNYAIAHFHSDGSIVKSGFNISFTASGCAGPRNYRGSSGLIVSPGFNKTNYGNNLNCSYSINATLGSKVVLNILYFDVENAGEPGRCTEDYLKIYDGPTSDYNPLDTLCGTNPATDKIYASTNRVFMNFITDSEVTRSGFSISYSTIPSS